MPDEQQSSSSSGDAKRRRSRKPSRKRKNPGAVSPPDVKSNPPSKAIPQESSRRSRRRRRKSHAQSAISIEETRPVTSDGLNARLSEDVFVYTHVLRSAEMDTYGFRSDPFLNHSRDLGDFHIDLSMLFPDDSSENSDAPIFDSALHGPILTHVTDDEATESVGDDTSSDDESDDDWLEDVQRAVDERETDE